MAAEAALSAVLGVVFKQLDPNSELFKFFRSIRLEQGLLKKLNILLNSVDQVIADAEERQYSNERVKKWLDDLKHEVFKAGDFLDEIATEASLQKQASGFQNASRKVRGYFTHVVNYPFGKTIESRLQEVLDNLEYLIKQNEILGLKSGVAGSTQLANRVPTSSLIEDEGSIYGRNEDKESMIEKLLSHSGSEPVTVIAITAMGGMGKTTLARLVYDDETMEKVFPLRVWLTVSEEFDVSLITKGILQNLGGSTEGSDDDLQLQLKNRLTGKKFLFVLDDIWNQNRQKWASLQIPFKYGASGSKIIVTTRSEKVAEIMHSIDVHHLKQLEDDDSWGLFTRHAFTDEQRNNADPNLVLVGREIVKKCGGLPLAIKTLARLLYNKKSLQDWNEILNSDIWELSPDDSDIIPSLRLSYHYLSSNLKLCFAYCSIFPKDYEIEKDVLIQLWMAEGLLDSNKRGKKSMTEVGNEVFDDLKSRSFFEPSLKSRSFFEPSKSNEKCFVMHDLVNDLAKSVIGEFYLGSEGGRERDVLPKARYFSFLGSHVNNVVALFDDISRCHHLRSFVSLGEPWCSVDILVDLVSRLTHLKYMRVLSLSGYSNARKLTNKIGYLKHLRYLDLSNSSIEELPRSICLMINLQTLKLKGCTKLTELPSDFAKLVNLCHLDLEGSGIKKMPKCMGKLNQLETISEFIVGEKKGYDLKELGALNRIKGTLFISKLENVTDPRTATEAKMKDKLLDTLKLRWRSWSESPEVMEQEKEERILEALQPNGEIKEVKVEGYGGRIFPNWFYDGVCLPNVVSLWLSDCRYCTRLPPLGQLPLLKELLISGFDGVKVIGEEFYGNGSSSFRSLTLLSMWNMKEWEEWNNKCGDEEGESSFPCLEQLTIGFCPKLRKSLPQHLPSLKQLELCECYNLESSVPKASRRRLRDESNSAEMESLPHQHQHQHHALLSSLRSLKISHCPKMMTCRMDWDLHHHHSLEEITITDEDVEWFPEEGLLPPNVKSLEFQGCSKLKEINYKGLLHLQSLQSLEIYSCPILSFESIPEVDGFPKSLSHLTIRGDCPLLKQRCEREKGQDWHKISHIPYDPYINLELKIKETILVAKAVQDAALRFI